MYLNLMRCRIYLVDNDDASVALIMINTSIVTVETHTLARIYNIIHGIFHSMRLTHGKSV